jgi:hypothetical protein
MSKEKKQVKATVIVIFLAAIILLLAVVIKIISNVNDSVTAFTTDAGDYIRTESNTSDSDSELQTVTYKDPTGCTVTFGRVTSSADISAGEAAVFNVSGDSGTVRWFDEEADTWNEQSLTDCTLSRGMYFFQIGTHELIIVTPQSYIPRENHSLEYLPSQDGILTAARTESGFSLSLQVGEMQAGTYSDYLVFESPYLSIDWNDPDVRTNWQHYSFIGKSRWCYDGYYYTTPSTYVPTGENYFYSMPDPYLACKMAKNTDQPACRVIALSMLDVQMSRQNEKGYLPTFTRSQWLSDSYGIDAGYYDTRWNSDLYIAVLDAVQSYGIDEWIDPAVRYGDYLMNHIGQHHFTFSDSEGNEGWLVQDYANDNGGSPTHSSLNHHVTLARFLYLLSTVKNDETYAETADRLVLGVELTADGWIKPDNNLHYAYMPDGTFDLADYPDLTYKDLKLLQNDITERRGTRSEIIDRLIESKGKWMQENGVPIPS